jgi:hypothetical protein
MGSAEGI